MMTRGKDKRDERRELVRRALRASTGEAEPDVKRLLASVPSLVDEARRRRARAFRDPIAGLVPLARRALPRLAAAAAALLLVSAGFYVKEVGLERETAVETAGGIDSLLLTGSWSAEDGDPLLGAILGQENDEENGNG